MRACFHTAPQRVQHAICMHVLVCLSPPIIAEQLCATRESEESNGRERQIAHTQITHIITHTHTHTRSRGMGALNHKIKKENKTKSRSVGRPAHTHSHCSRKAKHTQRESERSSTQCNENKTETVTVLRPCSQAGRQRCVSCKREHQRACMGVHAYIQWAHYVCASWGEVRARVHARGHTHRESVRRTSVCGRCTALSHSLSRGHHRSRSRTRNNKKKQKRGGGVGDRGAAVAVARCRVYLISGVCTSYGFLFAWRILLMLFLLFFSFLFCFIILFFSSSLFHSCRSFSCMCALDFLLNISGVYFRGT
ncbi:hypothetical protein TCDM_11469 [Trypanosoma cruzi Dm28c]|uniref:Uncharacterized protein n=1 Tax=Trypanosoma cruzi Dm28c TaxID=1416333 RepID=V5B4R0_TRYCR|nr:hypothetical protein TCDM_11469 [Trypanosoma cruzi Dm28c]